jgi:hypothetical protein
MAVLRLVNRLAIVFLAGALSPAAGGGTLETVTEVPPFVGAHTETWEEFGVKKFGSSQVSILGGSAVVSGTQLETATFRMFLLCAYYAGPSDGKMFLGADDTAALIKVSFSAPVSAFGAYWDTFPGIPEGCAGGGINFIFKDAGDNVVGNTAYPADRGGNKWHGFTFTTPVKTIEASGFYLTTDGMQATEFVPNSLSNISTRLRVEPGDNAPIAGFIVTGNTAKKVGVRGIGPSLTGFGISDALADPILELRDNNGVLLVRNDNWQDNSAQALELRALGLAPQHPNESGIVAILQPGTSYTAILAGKNSGSGTGLVEVYDLNQGASAQLGNISTRGFVQTGAKVMIGGFILGGGNGSAVAIRAIGPSLSQSGLSNLLADPVLELRDSNGALLVSNDNWQDDPATAGQLTAHGLAPHNSLESGMFTSLPSGAFTAILAGKDGGTGIGLVEIYNVR